MRGQRPASSVVASSRRPDAQLRGCRTAARRAPLIEGGPCAQVVGEPAEPVFDLGANGEGAVDAVRAVGRRLVLSTADTHGGRTTVRRFWLRAQRVVQAALPPRIRPLVLLG